MALIRKLSIAAAAGIVATLAALAAGRLPVDAQSKHAPIFEVDPWWPAPLPNHWVTGSTIGLSVDAQDNVWMVHRSYVKAEQARWSKILADNKLSAE